MTFLIGLGHYPISIAEIFENFYKGDDDDFDMVPQSPMAVDYSQIDSEAEDFDEIEKKPQSTRRKSSGSCDIILPSCAPSSGDIILPSIGGNSEISSRDSVSETPDGSKKPKDKKKKRKEYSEQDKLGKFFNDFYHWSRSSLRLLG